ncbi:lipoprotein LpqH [Mycobacterium talmoniae]|uniref:lipoprotein LpqH n=1 Tax=Mycobacterium talmoniae TaxID=1858794 RepID=UPI003BF8605C
MGPPRRYRRDNTAVHRHCGQAKATKDGKDYTITGTAWGMDAANNEVTKPFEVEVTCP